MSNRITIKFKDVYGNRLVYPVCDNAQHFANIAGTKTLSDATLKTIISMGYDIRLEAETLNL
tara:strand:+ start:517 stop:702 length:186 start_codon:yes stop_codon:yes gene_type:complete